MAAGLLFWAGLAVSAAIGLVYFRDLGDVVQMLLEVKRANMIRFIRNENRLIAVGLGCAAAMAAAWWTAPPAATASSAKRCLRARAT